MSAQWLSIEQLDKNLTRVRLAQGELLTAVHVEWLQQELVELLDSHPTETLVIDMAYCDGASSALVGALLQLQQSFDQRPRVRLYRAGDSVAKMLRFLNLAPALVEICVSAPQARRQAAPQTEPEMAAAGLDL